jgi:type VI secretion system protein ImpM
VTAAIHAPRTGYFGKLPSRADFVRANLPAAFVDAWDAWLQGVVSRSREALGADWLDLYLVSPLWRFVLAKRVCGPNVVAGVLMPSVDQVGRYFPFTVAIELPDHDLTDLVDLADHSWFAQAEAFALSALAHDFDLESVESLLSRIEAPARDRNEAGAGMHVVATGNAHALLLDLADATFAAARQRLCAEALRARLGEFSLWRTSGSQQVPRCLFACQGLPSLELYLSFLDGRWFGSVVSAPGVA